MPNPLSGYGVSDADYAVAVGMAMGEALNEGLVGMGIVAATALNRAQSPGTYMARSAALGDIFSAPFSAETMIDATRRGRSLPGAGRQFSPTFNSNIKGASTAGHQNFKAGVEAALAAAYDPSLSPSLGIRQDGYMRAQKAVEVAVKARDMGIDIGLGVEHFSAPGFETQAGVGRNRSRFGGHSVSPTGGWPTGVKAPTSKEFASRFAAAAALTGVEIPDDMVKDITTHVNRADIMSAASVVREEAQRNLSQQLGQTAMPGLNYSDLVQETGLRAIDVPDVTGKLGIDPVGALGFAENFGITPDNAYEAISLPDPIGAVEFGGYLDPVGPSPIDGPNAFTGPSSLAPAGAFSGQPLGPSQGFTSPEAASLFSGTALGSPQSFDKGWTEGFEGFNAPGLIDQASFDDRFSAGFPDPAPMSADTFNAIQEAAFQQPSISMGYPEAEMGITSPGALGMGQAFGVEAEPFSPSGFAAGTEAGPWGSVPDALAPSLEARTAVDRMDKAVSSRAIGNLGSDLQPEAIADRVMAELAPSAPQLASPSLDTLGISPIGFGRFDDAFSATPDLGTVSGLPSMAKMDMASVPSPALAAALAQTPQAPIAPAPVSAPVAAPAQALSRAPASVSVQAAAATPSYTSLPAPSLPDFAPMPPARPQEQKGLFDGFSLPDLSLPDLSVRGIGSALGFMDPVEKTGFMDAMANPDIAKGFSPGIMDGWTGGALRGAAFGALTGGIPGAVMGGIWGGIDPIGRVTDRVGNAFGGWFNGQGFDLGFGPMASWDTWDPSTYGFGDGFNSRGERSHTGADNSGNATVGDGSYGTQSGTNPNNPQGLL